MELEIEPIRYFYYDDDDENDKWPFSPTLMIFMVITLIMVFINSLMSLQDQT